MTPDWIAVDWGTSSLRAWAIGPDGAILARAGSDAGMNAVRAQGFEAALLELISDWLSSEKTFDVIACGMVGARQGWVEAPYAASPCAPPLRGVPAPTSDPRFRVTVLPGVSQSSPADVMRGEETQIAGLLAAQPDFDGVVCLPGTHTKWARVSAGEICHFRTAMTGELFDLIAHRSVLRHSVGPDWDASVFDQAVEDTLSRPERLASELFTIRADALLTGLPKGAAAARLSGLLIGAELAAMKPYWLGQDVALIGAGALSGHYAKALTRMGLSPVQHDVTALTLAGLASARRTVTA